MPLELLTFMVVLQLPVGVNESELEDRIIRHLAAAAAMGRTHYVSRREGSRSRSSAHGQPQFFVFSGPGGVEAEPAAFASASPLVPLGFDTVQPRSTSETARSSGGQSSLNDQDRAGPSEFQTFTSSWKSRLNAISTRYKESVSKGTRELKERLFNKTPSLSSNIGTTEARREVNAGTENVSRMMEAHENETAPNDINTPAASS